MHNYTGFKQICKISPIAMRLFVFVYACLSVCVYLCYFRPHRSDLTLTKIKNVKNDVCRLRHVPSNGVIAKIVPCDLVLHFLGQTFQVPVFSRSRILNCEYLENGER